MLVDHLGDKWCCEHVLWAFLLTNRQLISCKDYAKNNEAWAANLSLYTVRALQITMQKKHQRLHRLKFISLNVLTKHGYM